MHSLLKRQAKRFFGSEAAVPPEMEAILREVNAAYRAFDADRLMLERSLDLSSDELLKANSEMRALFQVFPDLLLRLDEDGRILDFKGNDPDLDIDPQLFIGKHIEDIPHPEVARQLGEALLKVKKTRALVRTEYTLAMNGRENVYEARLLPMYGESIVVIVRNITLAHSVSLLEATLESTADGILVDNRDGTMVHFNRKFLDMWRIPEEIAAARDGARTLGYVRDQLRDPEGFLARVRELYANVEAEGDDVIEFIDGRVFERTSKPQRVGGVTVGRVWSFRDVTERRQADSKLAGQKAFLRQVIDINPNLIFATDRAGRFTLVNQAVAEAYGTTVENLLGRAAADFNSNPAEAEGFRPDDLEVIDTRRDKLILEETMTDASGRTRLFQTIKRAIVSPMASQDQVLGVATDITERKKLEEQFLQSQKMEAIGALAGGVAHDFNNLLTVITGYTDLSLTRLHPGDQLRRNIEEIGKAAARAAQLTRQLLAFSRRQVLQPRVLDLNAVVVNMERMLGRLIGADIRLSTTLDPGSGHVKADPGQIEQVIMNLAVNARDAMPEGGSLTIRTRNLVVNEAIASQDFSLPPGSYVLLEISDTGSGMDDKTRSRVYEPFFTTKPIGKGTGLGLSTVYGIVKQSGGYIGIESELGRGTLFRVYLPLAPYGEVAEPAAPPGAVSRGCETILLVEDEDAVRGVTRQILEGNGYTVLEADCGEEALRISEAYQGSIHLVLSDLVMPGIGGRAAVNELLLQRPDLRAVYASGYVQEAVFKQQVLEPGTLFLQKPYSAAELIVAVCEALRSTPGETRKE